MTTEEDFVAMASEIRALKAALDREDQSRQHLQRQVQDLTRTKHGNEKPAVPRLVFNGEPTKWYDFRREFDALEQFVGWSDVQAKGALATCMRGGAHYAVTCLDHLRKDPQVSCAQLKDAYERRFVPEAATDVAILAFTKAVQGPNEEIQEFHGRVRHLFYRAHTKPGKPPLPEADVLTHLVMAFAKGLRKRAYRLAVRRASPTTYDEALQAAQREYSALYADEMMADQSAFNTNQPMTTKVKKSSEEPMEVGAMQQSAARRQPGPDNRCNVCNSPRHWQRDCPHRQQGAGRGRGGPSGQRGRGQPRSQQFRRWLQAMDELGEEGMPEDPIEAGILLAMAESPGVYEESDDEEGQDDDGREDFQ